MTDSGYYNFKDEAPETEPKPKGQTKDNGQHDPATWRTRLALRQAAALEGKEIKPREWVVDQWIPRGHLTGLYGPGSVGKTTLALQLCCAGSVEGGRWLGMPVRKSKPFGFFCEDDDDELARKIFYTARLYGHRRADYRDFAYLGRFGCENLLFARSRTGLATTALYADLCQLVADEHRDLLVFDGIPDIYALNINDQGEVTWALSMMLGMAIPTHASIMLLGHPNKIGSSEFTGCAAWENKPRARLYVGPVKNGNGEEPQLNDPRRVLSRSKANLSTKDKLNIVWGDGGFRVDDPQHMSMAEKCDLRARQTRVDSIFLSAFDQLLASRRPVSHAKRAGNWAPKQIEEAGYAGDATVDELIGAMNRLFAAGILTADSELWRNGKRQWVTGIARTGEVLTGSP